MTDRQRIVERYRDGQEERREKREEDVREREKKWRRDYWGAEAGRNHPLLTPDWRKTMERHRIADRLWEHNPYMIRASRNAARTYQGWKWFWENTWK